MPDHSLELVNTGIFGMSGSGKTTFAFRLLLNTPAVCNFIYDDRGQAAQRLNKKHVGTANELEDSLPSRWSVFNPSRMFPGCLPGTEQAESAFKFWCSWVYSTCRTGRGRKKILIDEMWKHCNTRKLPIELATMAQEGRVEGIELVISSQVPEKIPFAIRGQMTEVIAFKLQHAKAFEALEELNLLGFDRDEIQALPLGSFISFDRITGTKLAGKVF